MSFHTGEQRAVRDTRQRGAYPIDEIELAESSEGWSRPENDDEALLEASPKHAISRCVQVLRIAIIRKTTVLLLALNGALLFGPI